MKNKSPIVELLGVCDHYNDIQLGIAELPNGDKFPLRSQQIIGLKKQIPSAIFPIPISQYYFVFLVNINEFQGDTFKINVKDKDQKEAFSFELAGKLESAGDMEVIQDNHNYQIIAFKIPNASLLFYEPGIYNFFIKDETEEINVGCIDFSYHRVPKQTTKQIQAIKNDPLVTKAVKFSMQCNICKDEVKSYVGLKKQNKKDNKDNLIWYEDLPDKFECKCKKNTLNLKYIKENLHALLGQTSIKNDSYQSINSEKDKTALISIIQNFKELVEKSTDEETMQKFIEENPIILNCFAPEEIKFKSPIGKEFNDFTILNKRNELLFIEIEKPSTPLFKAKGGQHSELTHAFDQVRGWLQTTAKIGLYPILEDLNLDSTNNPNAITNIKGIVIAGRSKEEDLEYMAQLLNDHKNIDFYTYDHLIEHLVSLLHSLRAI